MLLGQVGIGTTTPHASAQLEIAAPAKGFLPPRVSLQSTVDVSTIVGPAAGLIVYNQADAGSGNSAVTKGIYNFDGTQWVAMNNTPAASTTLPVVGTIGAFTIFGIDLSQGFYWQMVNSTHDDNTGLSVTLPPGKWEVKVGVKIVGGDFINGLAGQPALATTRASWSHRFYLKDSDTAMAGPRWDPYKELDTAAPGSITQDTIPGLARAIEREHNLIDVQGNNTRVLFVEGSIWIHNSGATAKSYYLFHTEVMSPAILNYALNQIQNEPQSIYYGANLGAHVIGGIGGSGQGANYIVAYPHPTQ